MAIRQKALTPMKTTFLLPLFTGLLAAAAPVSLAAQNQDLPDQTSDVLAEGGMVEDVAMAHIEVKGDDVSATPTTVTTIRKVLCINSH